VVTNNGRQFIDKDLEQVIITSAESRQSLSPTKENNSTSQGGALLVLGKNVALHISLP